jgi:CheY-like chemotaxis protein
MTPEQVQRLFQPFERLGREQGPVEGTGIGLVITRHLVEMMGGRISVHSRAGQGSEFVLELALAEHDTAGDAAGSTAASRRPARKADTHGSVLYVDDNETNRVLMQGYFALRPGVVLHLAADGESAIAVVARHRPQLALVDMRLPDMHGLQLIERLRDIDRQLPCVAVSADAMPDDIAAATAAGFIAYLTKPLTASSLLAMVDRHLPRDRVGVL